MSKSIRRGRRMWGNVPDIPRDEQAFLDMFLNPRFQWVARDNDGSLNFYENEPTWDMHDDTWNDFEHQGVALYNVNSYTFMEKMFANIFPGEKYHMGSLTGGVDPNGEYANRYTPQLNSKRNRFSFKLTFESGEEVVRYFDSNKVTFITSERRVLAKDLNNKTTQIDNVVAVEYQGFHKVKEENNAQ